MSDQWSFDPDWLTVNHGSFGACPRTVRQSQARWREQFERQPTAFTHHKLPALLRTAMASVARFLNADPNDTVFVDNATAGCNAVLRSRRFAADDEILIFDQTYGAVRNTVRFVAEQSGARVVTLDLPFPNTSPSEVTARLRAALTGRTALAVLDHITSPGALVLPIVDMVRACHQRSVPVLVDGAHVPGQIPLDLTAVDADWYAGNLHKWLLAPSGTGFLHARADRQAGLHPTSISHGLGRGFLAEFDWTGTRDASGWLAAPDAIAFHQELGGRALMVRNASLARQGADTVASILETQAAPGCLPGAAMALARLPERLGHDAPGTRELLIARRVDAPVHALAGSLWVRMSAQAYNAPDDYRRLAEEIRALPELRHTLRS